MALKMEKPVKMPIVPPMRLIIASNVVFLSFSTSEKFVCQNRYKMAVEDQSLVFLLENETYTNSSNIIWASLAIFSNYIPFVQKGYF